MNLYNKGLLTILISITLMLISTPALADYKIILKNGNKFIADNYKDVNSRIKFYKMGGVIEIDRGNIESIKKVRVTKPVEESPPAETVKKDSPGGPATIGKGTDTQAKDEEIKRRLREIAKRKDEMKAEGEKLTEEKKKLNEDIKKEGRVTSPRKERELEHQKSAIEERIKRFNEELYRLEQEQERLLKSLQ